jgi:hypothetical protein
MSIEVNKKFSCRGGRFKDNLRIFVLQLHLKEAFDNRWNSVHQIGQLSADFLPRQVSGAEFERSVSNIR